MASRKTKGQGVSLAKGPVGLIGLALLAYGVIAFLLGANGFSSSPIDGTVNGDTFLGIEANGWTSVLFAGAGALLLFGSPFHWGAKSTAMIVGLVLGAASVIALVDGTDVFGIFAANGLTKLVLGAAATALLLLSLLPRVGKGRRREHDEDLRASRRVVRERPVAEREGRFARERESERLFPREREVVAPADGDGPRDHRRDRL